MSTINSLPPDEVKVHITFDDIRIGKKLTTHETKKFPKRSFSYTILGFTQLHFESLDDYEVLVRLIPGSHESDKPINITQNDKLHLKCDCFNGSFVNGIREPIFYNFALSSPPGHRIYKEPRINRFKKIKKSVLSHVTFYLQDQKSVDFSEETISFTCQIFKSQYFK